MPWVKGSGGDLGSIREDGFACVDLERHGSLEAAPRTGRRTTSLAHLPPCVFGNVARAASIDTPLHALLPFAHVDHTHPDAVIALRAATAGRNSSRRRSRRGRPGRPDASRHPARAIRDLVANAPDLRS